MTIGLITALAVILARTQSRLVAAVQKLLTLIATGLLPVVSLLALLFIVTLPFTGLEAISARVSAAGLLSTLTLMLLLLVAIVNEPQKRVLPYPRVLRGMISASLCVARYICCWRAGRMGTHSAIRLDAGSSVWRADGVCLAGMVLRLSDRSVTLRTRPW
ncbi:membrane protein [Salmonella enterica subsp. enterica serovar Sanjuan]|uniref:Membrane protein n=1 Tax=Salmonella enterica subsp. enterica serovar Sanjuan TaxID=1160765 RepID=A0A3S4GSD4_SALET|nr:membrane protein [Salmonella enterica subsp. enterica serovar Sanjuan]